MGVLVLLLILAACGIGALLWHRSRKQGRVTALRSYVDEHGFAYLGQQLPPTLDLSHSLLRECTSVTNAFSGMRAEKEFLFFDCQLPGVRSRHTQSVLALARYAGEYPACRWDRALREERAGEWKLIYHEGRAWTVNEIDAHLSTL